MEVYAKTYQRVEVDPIQVLEKLFSENCFGQHYIDVELFQKNNRYSISYEEYRFQSTIRDIDERKYYTLLYIKDLIDLLKTH